jgi:hypothetical protein
MHGTDAMMPHRRSHDTETTMHSKRSGPGLTISDTSMHDRGDLSDDRHLPLTIITLKMTGVWSHESNTKKSAIRVGTFAYVRSCSNKLRPKQAHRGQYVPLVLLIQ